MQRSEERAPNVALLDERAGVVDRLRQALLEHACLQAAVQEFLDVQGQNEIELLLVLRATAHENGAQNQQLASDRRP